MDKNHRFFKKDIHFGECYLLDINKKKIIATGQGHFDSGKLKLYAHFNDIEAERYGSVVVILKTDVGYIAPIKIHPYVSIPMGSDTKTYSMKSFLSWSTAKSVDHILDECSTFDVNVKSGYGKARLKIAEDFAEAELVKCAENRDLEKVVFDRYAVEASSTFSTSFGRDDPESHMNILPRIHFKISLTHGYFSPIDAPKLLHAFQLYWITSHDHTDGKITSFFVGDLQYFTEHMTLKALADNVTEHKAYLAVDALLELEYLAKSIHFHINPENKKGLSSSSKIGLAFSRIIDRRFKDYHRIIDHEIIDLIFALQSMAEEIADKSISQSNKNIASQTKDGITKVLDSIKSIEKDLPTNVKEFYLQDPDKIYGLITRPTFMQSVKLTFNKLGIDFSEYESLIKEVDKARRQVVHSEKYDGEFLIDLLTHGTTEVERDNDGRVRSIAFGVKTGTLDELYNLIKKMARLYLNDYKI